MKDMKVWKNGHGEYSVSSETREGVSYKVRQVTLWVCACPSFMNREGVLTCKHIQRARAWLDESSDSNKLVGEVEMMVEKMVELLNNISHMEEAMSSSGR